MDEKHKEIIKKHLLITPRWRWETKIWPSVLKVIGQKHLDMSKKEIRIEFRKICKEAEKELNENFKPLSIEDLRKILGLTIKKDEINKVVTFLCQLSAYTENAQFNISYNAPSSTGKSYIPTEIARLFPKEDVMEIGYCSPTAFFHDIGKPDKTKGGE